ncbi:hypothetical protein [Ligilactobacillus murinus]|nr:hypothetical protein [Ligilactobacillus murinus]MCR1879887.1 hypothetical protein [Ligilactobacillus murinus]MCZ0673140.1 hypothetical protein [Ligilactobacillus murinus]MCZ0673325.1 hypothetical protein [Ligilactobacillus murinus]
MYQAIRGYQAKLREIVKANDFLTRQYNREQIISPNRAVIEQFRRDVRYNMARKKVTDKASTPISKPELNKTTKNFRKSGGKIFSGPEVDERLKNIGAEASIIGNDIMMISSKAGRAAIREELIRIKQARYYGAPSSDEDVFLREIEAGKILLKNATKWKLIHKEIEDTKLLIKKYTNDLNKLKG